MKKLLSAVVLLFATLSVSAATLYDQLCAFNFNWKKYPMQAPAGEARNFSCDRELIQAHLSGVLSILRAAPVDQLSDVQRVSRAHMIELLDGYRIAGKFPLNYYRGERIPVFIDEHGTHCAVGYLLMMTGHDDVAQRISKNDNYVWVKDLHDPAVPGWQEASGLSFEELALIQGAYDSYAENGFFLVNKYETPQMPTCTTAYFMDDNRINQKRPENIWCYGEGKNGVLNGKWIQNYAAGKPWIVGYYENGKRSGQWEEYYQGTKQLCRTEQWRFNKLNGTRTRYDMAGNVIEEILFANGDAVSKINYDRNDSLVYIRTPLDSNRVWTQVMNFNGELIACGHETVYNPGHLLWFQNIELTALNSASIRARDESTNSSYGSGLNAVSYGGLSGLYNTPPLVQYFKQGDWIYYQDHSPEYASKKKSAVKPEELFKQQYQHYGPALITSTSMLAGAAITTGYDSIHAAYKDNQLLEFYGYTSSQFIRIHVSYYEKAVNPSPSYLSVYSRRHSSLPAFWFNSPVKEAGTYNSKGQRIGEWKYYNEMGVLCKTENYLVPEDEVAIVKP